MVTEVQQTKAQRDDDERAITEQKGNKVALKESSRGMVCCRAYRHALRHARRHVQYRVEPALNTIISLQCLGLMGKIGMNTLTWAYHVTQA